MEKKRFAVEGAIPAEEIKRIRKRLKLTQRELADLLGCSRPTVERWEKEDTCSRGLIVLLMKLLERNMDYIKELEIPPQNLPVRMWYMYKEKYCTLIDVDETKNLIRIKNYTDNVMFRAFGTKETPSMEDYRAFLESRCFPESRDKMKLVLQDLGLPFYDPYLIIQKTEGRMAEDDFWIKIEKGETE